MAKIADIGDAVATRLNAGSYAVSVSAVRSYVPTFELKDLSDLKVSVVLLGRAGVPIARKLQQITHQVQIGVQKRVDPDDVAENDALLTLCEDIVDDFLGNTNLGETGTQVVSAEQAPVYVPNHLTEERVFTSIITLNVRETRARGG